MKQACATLSDWGLLSILSELSGGQTCLRGGGKLEKVEGRKQGRKRLWSGIHDVWVEVLPSLLIIILVIKTVKIY